MKNNHMMTKYDYYQKRNIPVEYLNFQFVAPTTEIAELVLEASEELHWFSVKKKGKHRTGRSIYDPYSVGLDNEYLAVNFIMHVYYTEKDVNTNVQVNPLLFNNNVDFDLRIIAVDERNKAEVLSLSKYLDGFKVSVKGKGTNKPGSKVLVGVTHTDQRINQVYTWLKELHKHPELVIIGETSYTL